MSKEEDLVVCQWHEKPSEERGGGVAALSLLASCDVKAAFQPSLGPDAGSWPFSPASPCGARLGSVSAIPVTSRVSELTAQGFSPLPPPVQYFSGDLALFFGRGASHGAPHHWILTCRWGCSSPGPGTAVSPSPPWESCPPGGWGRGACSPDKRALLNVSCLLALWTQRALGSLCQELCSSSKGNGW